VDFCPAHWANILSYYKVFQDLNLDHLFVCSFAPRTSKYNPIERVWSHLTQSLAQVTLGKNASEI